MTSSSPTVAKLVPTEYLRNKEKDYMEDADMWPSYLVF